MKSDTGIFCIKNYRQLKGLSFRFFSDQAKDFEVSGPFGKGLVNKEEGTHIAFAAGTGVLCFVDLVAYIALKNLRTKSRESIQKQSFIEAVGVNEFKLILYVSFPNRE